VRCHPPRRGAGAGEGVRADRRLPHRRGAHHPGFDLAARWVIHAVGPVWHGGGADEAELLESAYRCALELARSHQCRSVAFPSISTGVYGYPIEEATEIAVRTVRAFAPEAGPVALVHFACFSPDTLAAYRRQGVEG
jgi:O-acetyl-ADP-ribose deacetylase